MDRWIAILLLVTALSWSLHVGASAGLAAEGDRVAAIEGPPLEPTEGSHEDPTAEFDADDTMAPWLASPGGQAHQLTWGDALAPTNRFLRVVIRPPIA